VSAVGVYYLEKKLISVEEDEERKVIPSTDQSGMNEGEVEDERIIPSVEESVAEEVDEDLTKESTAESNKVEDDNKRTITADESGDHKEDDGVVTPLSEATVDKEVPEDMTEPASIGSGTHKEDDAVSVPLIEAIIVKETDDNKIIPTDNSGNHKEDDTVATPLSESNVDEESEENVATIQLSIEDVLRKHPEMANYMCWGSFLDKQAVKDSNKKDVEPDRLLTGAVQPKEIERTTMGIKSSDNSPAVATVVARHYNGIHDKGYVERNKDKIIELRRFNNFIKRDIIEFACRSIRWEKGSRAINVLDLCCGKGGDLPKWKWAEGVKHVIFADIAQNSIVDCKRRYHQMNLRKQFTAEFIAADCSAVRIKNQFKNPDTALGLVSLQFALHYFFESQSQVETMLANVADNLALGGYFIGTTIDADTIMKRLRRDQEPTNRRFGNSIFSVDFPVETPLDPPPRFGAKYNFKLEGSVDCPEFLVDFRTFEELAAKYGLKLVRKCRFEDFITEERNRGNDPLSIYKLSKEELEVASMYLSYVFQKEGRS